MTLKRYNPHRSDAWNYGGKNWRLSRSKIDLFKNCPRCFYVDNKLGAARVRGFPFNINSAVDTLFKKEFDIHRKEKTPHPIMEANGLGELVPFAHENMDRWRENFEGIHVMHKPTGFTVSGAVDDIWVDKNGTLYVVDYKSTSKDGHITTLDEDWQIGYKRQMEVYQWLLRKSGFTVSNTGYFVYANAHTDRTNFNNTLEFETTLIPYEGDDSWVEPTLMQIKKCLDDPRVPSAAPLCDHCAYREAVGKALLKNKGENVMKAQASESTADKTKETQTGKTSTTTLF